MLRSLPLLAALILWLPGMLVAQPIITLRGKVVDGDGRPVTGATVWIGDEGLSLQTGPDGSFQILTVKPGWQRLRVRHTGYTSIVSEVKVAQGPSAPVVIEIVRLRECGGTNGPPLVELPGMELEISMQRYSVGSARITGVESLDRSPRPTLFGGAY